MAPPPTLWPPMKHVLVRCQECTRFPGSSGEQCMKFCQGRNKPRQRREASPSRTLSEHGAETKIEQRTAHCLPKTSFLFFSPSNRLDDDFFFSQHDHQRSSRYSFVNTTQKCCERGQGQVPPAKGWPGFHVSCYYFTSLISAFSYS